MQVIDGAKTFLLEGSNRKAVLLIHGYTGTPSEMLPLGNYLNQLGYTVLCRRLPGHGTSVGDLERTTAEDWYSAAKDACEGLLGRYEDVYVAGLSMGGLLAIKLAALLPVKKAAFISTPIFVQDKRAPLLPLLRFFKALFSKIVLSILWFLKKTCYLTKNLLMLHVQRKNMAAVPEPDKLLLFAKEGKPSYTAKIEIRYRQPLAIGEEVVCTGRELRRKGRLVEMQGTICKKDGTLLAECLSKMMIVDEAPQPSRKLAAGEGEE